MNPEQPPAGKCPFGHGSDIVTEATASTVPVPDRIAKLPVLRGYHVPAFVEKVNGEYDFRIMSRNHLIACVKRSLCWVCGEPLGRNKSFVIGPMCGITRTSAEPPSHHECAVYSAMACPFLTRPNMKRRDHENLKKVTECAGEQIDRNPGVSAVWTCAKFERFNDGRGGVLFKVGEPDKVEWYREGRLATRAEVLASIDSGVPLLRKICDEESTPERCAESHRQLDELRGVLEQYLPEEGPTEGQQRLMDLINKMDHMEMCRLWRFAEPGHPYFDQSKPYYAVFKARLDAFGGFTPEISKAIGH